jgi:integrase
LDLAFSVAGAQLQRPEDAQFGPVLRCEPGGSATQGQRDLRTSSGIRGNKHSICRSFASSVRADEYLEVKTRRWKASTRATTEQIIDDHILSSLGDRMLHSITRRELQRLLDELANAGKSQSVVGHVRWQLAAIFKMAVGDGLVTINPTDGLENPRCKPPGKKLVLSLSEFKRAQMCLKIRERLFLRLAVVEGFRPGEIVGLKLGDISDGEISVRRRVYRRIIDTPKSVRGRRSVPMTERTNKILTEYVETLLSSGPDDWLFASERPVQPIDYSNLFRRHIRPALERVGLGWVNFQTMRRTHATVSGEVEKDARVRAEIIGHSVDVHENEYRQVPPDAMRLAMKKLGDRFE